MVTKLLGILIVACVYCFFFLTPANAATIYVTPGQSIQNTVNSANSGDVIVVKAGQYQESIRISKNNLTVRCEEMLQCTARSFEIWASNVTLDGFKLVGGTSFGVEVRFHNNIVKNIDISGVLYDFGLPNGQGATVGISFFGTGHVFDGIYIHDLNQYHVDDLGYSEPHQDCFISWDVPSRGGSGAFITINNVLCDMPQYGDSYVSKIFASSGGSHDWTVTNLVGITPLACLFYDEAYNINISHSTFIGGDHPTPQGCKFMKLNSNPAPHDNTITYSIFQNITATPAFYDYVTGNNNCFWQVTSHQPDPGDIFSNPLLGSDWSVPSNSPCRNMGANLQLFTPPSTQRKAGDTNDDNIVDGKDYVVWLNNYGKALFGYTYADFNDSGKVDGVDYVVWLNNYGK